MTGVAYDGPTAPCHNRTASTRPRPAQVADPPRLLGVVCLGLGGAFEELGGWDEAWRAMQAERKKCADLTLTWAQVSPPARTPSQWGSSERCRL